MNRELLSTVTAFILICWVFIGAMGDPNVTIEYTESASGVIMTFTCATNRTATENSDDKITVTVREYSSDKETSSTVKYQIGSSNKVCPPSYICTNNSVQLEQRWEPKLYGAKYTCCIDYDFTECDFTTAKDDSDTSATITKETTKARTEASAITTKETTGGATTKEEPESDFPVLAVVVPVVLIGCAMVPAVYYYVYIRNPKPAGPIGNEAPQTRKDKKRSPSAPSIYFSTVDDRKKSSSSGHSTWTVSTTEDNANATSYESKNN